MACSPGDNNEHQSCGRAGGGGQRRGRLLIVEPDPLTRWSLATYLERWFDVTSVDCEKAPVNVPDLESLAALVLTDELPAEQARTLEHQARQRNPDLIAVRIGTDVSGGAHASADEAARLEKPFELARLARLLGVPDGEIPR